MRNSLKSAMVATGIFISVLGCNSGGNNNTEVKNDSTTQANQEAGISTAPKTDTVIIEGMQFKPQQLSVHLGDTILWINKDIVVHNVTEDTAQTWTSGNIPIDSSWRKIPESSFNYLCSIHPTMKASVTVVK